MVAVFVEGYFDTRILKSAIRSIVSSKDKSGKHAVDAATITRKTPLLKAHTRVCVK